MWAGSARTPAGAVIALVALATSAMLLSPAQPARASEPTGGTDSTSTLVLYDTGGPWGWLGETYGQAAAHLASRFGTWTALPVTEYAAGTLDDHDAVIYAGSTYDEPLPQAFLDDVLAETTPTLWLGSNIWQLHNRAAQDDTAGYFIHQFGWQYRGLDPARVDRIRYKGHLLDRNGSLSGGIMDVVIGDPTRATVLAEAIRADGTSFPWAVRSSSLTYVGEIPFSFPTESDRYLAVADLMFDLLAPQTRQRHRALVRIEDVSPASDPARIRAFADLMHSRSVPFSMAVIPEWRDPLNREPGAPTSMTFRDRPEMLAALKYAVRRGGTIILHGYTHQLGTTPNPFNGRSGTDYEFYQTRLDRRGEAVMVGPVRQDSVAWAGNRMDAALRSLRAAGLGRPAIWEFPHYAASPAAYAAARQRFSARYERVFLFPGTLAGRPDTSRLLDQFFPYEVVDVYGSRVIPENIGHLELDVPESERVTPRDLIRRARANLVVRDGFASFFMHSFYDPKLLAQVIDGVQALGYRFVSPAQVLRDFPR